MTNRLQAGTLSTTFKYDPLGNLTNVVYPTSSNVVLQFDMFNRLTNMIDGIGTTKFTWTDGDQLASEDGPWSFDTVNYTYNNRLRSGLGIQQVNASPWTQSYSYDDLGRLGAVLSAAGNFAYSFLGVSTVDGSTASDLIYTVGLPSGATSLRTYDDAGRLLTTTLNSALGTTLDEHDYIYDAGSRRTKQTFKNNNYFDYTYDNIGQLKTAKGYESGGTTSRQHEQFGYAYDNAGSLIRRTNNALIQTLNVDGQNRLASGSRSGTLTVAGGLGSADGSTTVTVSGTGLTSGSAAVYSDATWARTGATLANGSNYYTASATDGSGRTSQDSVSVSLPATLSFTYDSRGNLTSDGNRYLSYDDENQLISVTASNGWRSEFNYDGMLRRRIRKEYTWSNSAWLKTNEVRYVYDGMLVVQERDANNLALVSYTRGTDLSGSLQNAGGIGGLLARTDHQTASSAYYSSDGNGNVTSLINSNDAAVATYSYDPFGNILAMSGPLASANLYRFSSKEAHANSGLVCYGYRFYDPNLQRWINRDPIGETGGLNLFTMVQNSPVNLYDGVGLLSKKECNELRGQIITKAEALLDTLRKYDPKEDGKGGHPFGWGQRTKKGGHYQKLSDKKNGLKNDITKYLKDCIKQNDDNDPNDPVPKWIDEMVARPVPEPIYSKSLLELMIPQPFLAGSPIEDDVRTAVTVAPIVAGVATAAVVLGPQADGSGASNVARHANAMTQLNFHV